MAGDAIVEEEVGDRLYAFSPREKGLPVGFADKSGGITEGSEALVRPAAAGAGGGETRPAR